MISDIEKSDSGKEDEEMDNQKRCNAAFDLKMIYSGERTRLSGSAVNRLK